MGGIFISYRREDSAGWTGRLAEHLKERFGEQSIFMDLDGITPGLDFTVALHEALASCDVLLAVIGPEWVTALDKTGNRRIDNPDDWVRIEIAAALKRNIRVIPVLVGGAEVLTQDQLPDDLDPLAHRQAYELTDRRWQFDIEQLISTFPPSLHKPWFSSNMELWRSTPVVLGMLVFVVMVGVWAVFTSVYVPPLPPSDAFSQRPPASGTGSIHTALPIETLITGGADGTTSKIDPAAGTSTPHVDTDLAPITLRVGQEARLKDHVTSCTYKVLTAQMERSRSDLSLLRMIVRVTNEGSMTTNFGDSNFRLLVDNVPRAPTSNLNDLVDAHSAKDGTIVFAVPASATRFVLQLLMGDEEATFPL